MNPERYEAYNELRNAGVDVHKERIPPMNAGGKSETLIHHTAKNMVAFVAARNHGYMTDIEVDTPYGEIDVCLWGLEDRLTWAIECETSPSEETFQDKKERYVDQLSAVDDIQMVNLNDLPVNMVAAMEHIESELGL